MSTPRRFTKSNPCPICTGHDGLGRGQGLRCWGYLDHTGEYARCTREEHAGRLEQNRDGTYSHRVSGPCRCGLTHGHSLPMAERHTDAAPTPRRRSEQRFRSYHTLAAFLRRHYGDGTAVRFWVYHTAAGNEAFRVLRVDYSAGDGSTAKSYRPCHQANDGKWLLSRPAGLLPLYNLPGILAAPPEATIVILEGEKCCGIARDHGVPYATTSAHGAKAPRLTDWSPLAGRQVSVIRDADEDGAGYATQVNQLLAALTPPAQVRIVTLPGLAEGDIEQWADARRIAGRSNAEILAELRALIAGGLDGTQAPADNVSYDTDQPRRRRLS